MDKIYDICCGIDVHKKLIVACLNHKRKKELREFGATTRELMELAEWLQKNECEIVAMESTGSYWKPLYNIMESYGLHAIVVNPAHMKAVPGRKTDVKDAEWIAELLQHGLLQPSYIPSKDQRELRELVQYRKSLVGERTRELNRLQKMLEGANIKLSGTVTNINGKSARKILFWGVVILCMPLGLLLMLVFGFWFVTEVSCQIVYGDLDRVFHIEESIRKLKDAELEAALREDYAAAEDDTEE